MLILLSFLEGILMKDLLQETEIAIGLAELLHDHKGIAVIAMDMRDLNFWTDFFIIATVTSSVHLSGLEKFIKEFSRANDIEILRRSRRPAVEEEWCLIDLGNIVIHLMNDRARAFFELEKLWSAAPRIFEKE